MQRFRQLVFVAAILSLSWLGMMAIHELGHVVGALASGGSVTRVILHPLAISRTDVFPNPHPAIVVWLGPVIDCLLPLTILVLVPHRWRTLHNLARFFAGFCLIANGAYISVGTIDHVGDAGEMLRTGTPRWVLFAFGAATVPLGLVLWHRLGSLRDFITHPSAVTPRMAWYALTAAVVVLASASMLSSR